MANHCQACSTSIAKRFYFSLLGSVLPYYCTFCFRWAQFVGKATRFNSNDADQLHRYLAQHKEVTDLLVTGGDPMVMRTRKLKHYLEGLLQPEFDHIKTIRIGTKALTFWPYRFITDPDADELMRLLEKLVRGKHVSIMAHLNHHNELRTEVCEEAIRRLRATGAQIRWQAPLLRHINDDPKVWADMGARSKPA